MASPKVEYISAERKVFPEKRIDFYKKHAKSGLIDEVQSAISERAPPPIEDLLVYLGVGNERTSSLVRAFEEKFNRLLKHPQPGDYIIAEKECVDARAATAVVWDLIEHARIHERTAASVVRKGCVFFVLDKMVGMGFVKTHFACGGEDVAHKCHTENKLTDLDPHIRSIVESIPPAVATIKNPVLRSQWNSRIQAAAATALVQSRGLGNEVHPVMVSWERWPSVDVEWCSTTQVGENTPVTLMRENFKTLWALAAELGRDPVKQYSHTIVYYDPFRLGRINNPRVIFDSLPNELFCVTENFRDIHMTDRQLSTSAIGSLRYAGFLDAGHVMGVGKAGGNRHVMILDPDPKVIRQVKALLLASSEDIKTLTNGGMSITEARFDLDTARVEFLK